MNLIERYLHEVGRYLPPRNRADILAEIKSYLLDKLDERVEGEPQEADVIALLKEVGSPQKLASSYPGGQQYLIGPDLYPFFRMVAWIVLACVTGAQLLAFGVNAWIGEETLNVWESLASLISSLPGALGSVVIVFLILQHFGVQPKLDDEPWDPSSLPEIEGMEEIKKGEQIFGIVGGSILLAIVAVIPEKIGIYIFPGGEFYPDPVILQYSGWIFISLLAAISLNIYLLWQGRWSTGSRLTQIAVNFISIAVLAVLVQGHSTWLAAHGSAGFFASIEKIETMLAENLQVFGMEVFKFAFGIALIVTVIETIVLIVNLVRGFFTKTSIPEIPVK